MQPPAGSLPLYGLDIETDTSRGGLSPLRAGIIAVAVCGDPAAGGSEKVLVSQNPRGESDLLAQLDQHLASLEPGILITWNGARFDLPFLHYRAAVCGVAMGLHIEGPCRQTSGTSLRAPLFSQAKVARWHHHAHADAIGIYRRLARGTGMSCALKEVARRSGIDAVREVPTRVHLLDEGRLRRYVASDARITRVLAEMQSASVIAMVERASSSTRGHRARGGNPPDLSTGRTQP